MERRKRYVKRKAKEDDLISQSSCSELSVADFSDDEQSTASEPRNQNMRHNGVSSRMARDKRNKKVQSELSASDFETDKEEELIHDFRKTVNEKIHYQKEEEPVPVRDMKKKKRYVQKGAEEKKPDLDSKSEFGGQKISEEEIRMNVQRLLKGEKTAKDILNQEKKKNYISKNSEDDRNPNFRNTRNNANDAGSHRSFLRSQTVPHVEEKEELEYQNHCNKFTKSCEQIDEDLDDSSQIRKIKKLMFNTELFKSYHQKPKNIKVMKALDYPVIFLSYEYGKEVRYMLLREISRSLKNLVEDFHMIVSKLYESNYLPVDLQYEEEITQFILMKAKKLGMKLVRNRRFRENQKEIEPLFYYCVSKSEHLNFVYFDQYMKEIQMDERYIRENQTKNPEAFKVFEKFQRRAMKDDDQLSTTTFGNEEFDSDLEEGVQIMKEENIKMYKQPKDVPNEIKMTERKLNQLLDKDLSELESAVEEKNDELNELIDRNHPHQDDLVRLGDQVEELQSNLDNFNDVKRSVEKWVFKTKNTPEVMPHRFLEVLRMSVKKMIIAQKQLETRLPILAKKRELFSMLDKQNLVILEGETGSGKSTQLPQLLCEYFKLFENPDAKPVLVTQPRKIATRSLAERVADEMGEKRGGFVDSVTSVASKYNPDAKIIFKIDRLVLDELVESPLLEEYSCLVIDEAHERTISIDVILGLIKELLRKRKDFKVIVTSASMDIALFEKYFQTKTLKVSGRMFPVEIAYRPSREEEVVKKVEQLIDRELLTSNGGNLKDQYKGHVLVFCSDTSEITRLCDIFQKRLNPKVFQVLPLHGRLSSEEQKRAFTKTREHKVIFANRIAETAITIDGVKVVIDPGFDRQMIYDQKSKFSSMKLGEISKSSAKQRAGRAGRTQRGFCFRLYTQQQFENRRHNKMPEIRNIALDTLILRLKVLKIENIFDFPYIEKPDPEGMKNSLESLKMIGCIDQREKITTIGQFLVKIPIEPFLARAIIEALLMEKTLDIYRNLKNTRDLPIIIIEILCMVMNASNLFRIPEQQRQRGQFIKYTEFSHKSGDFFFLKHIYEAYKYHYSKGRQNLRSWLRDNYLADKTLYQVKDLIREISLIIQQFEINRDNFKEEIYRCRAKLMQYEEEKDRVLACLTTSFCSNLCLYSGSPFIGYTYLNQKRTVSIYGTSSLSLLGICPKWVLCYDLYENKDGRLYCKVAHEVTFDFLKNTVNPYVYSKYKIETAEKANPFYKEITYKTETFVYQKVKEANHLRDKKKEYNFFNDVSLNFDEKKNEVTVFFECEEEKRNLKTNFEIDMEDFINLIRGQARYLYRHNYIGNIFVELAEGFEIKLIEFGSSQIKLEISELTEPQLQDLQENWSHLGQMQVFSSQTVHIYFENEDDVLYFEQYLQFLKTDNEKLSVRKQLVDKRKKIPQTKIFLHWFAGKSEKNNILLSYKDQQKEIVTAKGVKKQVYNPAATQLNYIKQAETFRSRRDQRQQRQLIQKLLTISRASRLTKKENGINIFNTSMDEIDIHELLLEAIKKNKIGYGFKAPDFIRKFREPERPECAFTNAQWIEEINKLIDRVSSKTKNEKQNCIRVWGYSTHSKDKEKSLSTYEKSFRVDMRAQIKTLEVGLLQRMKRIYDGQFDILGYEKFHVTAMFDQCVASVSKKVFDNLYDEYTYNVDLLKTQFPSMIFDVNVSKIRRNSQIEKVFLYVRSSNREDLMKPMRILGELFTPHYIVVEDNQFRYLNNEKGGECLDWIEEDYGYKIYFGFDKYSKKIKLYCESSLVKEIHERLKYYLSLNKYYNEYISYRGKNIKRIEKLLKEKKKAISESNRRKTFYLDFEIKFSERKIHLIADEQTFTETKNQINGIHEEANKECQICCGVMITPYKLLDCKHTFCWSCLANSIREFRVSESQFMKCPFYFQDGPNEGQPCGGKINMNDVITILSEQEMQKICDVKISKYVEGNPKYLTCKTANCEQLFDKKEVEEEGKIDCELCGKQYCLKCNEDHGKNYTCEEWAKHQNFEKDMGSLGIFKCPKCNNGIQKNGGCNHITCKCGAHVCYNCKQYFKTATQCYDHLAKCGGIFPADVDMI